jgi:hypothetical protein
MPDGVFATWVCQQSPWRDAEPDAEPDAGRDAGFKAREASRCVFCKRVSCRGVSCRGVSCRGVLREVLSKRATSNVALLTSIPITNDAEAAAEEAAEAGLDIGTI